jgi:hypothetical protein
MIHVLEKKTRSKTRKNMKGGSLRTSYGVVILPKKTRLYHASSNKLCDLPSKPVLFMTLHPSDWYAEDSHISVIELQKEVTLLFMVRHIRNMRIFSSLNNHIGNGKNLEKMNYEKIKCWLPFFQKEKLDGWFSSIENKNTIEFAILNDPSILKIVECLPIEYNWMNSTINNNMELIPKNWGTKYKISTYNIPIKMILNSRFKDIIETYMQQVSEQDPYGTTLSLILKNASITYIDAPLENIKWCS